MPVYEVIDPEQLPPSDTYDAPFTTAEGSVTTRSRSPEGFDQFIVYATVAAGAVLRWDTTHGDEGVFVRSGELEVDGQRISAKGAIVIESTCPATARAVVDCELIHVGSTVAGPRTAGAFGPPTADGHRVHVHQPDGKRAQRYAPMGKLWEPGSGDEPVLQVSFYEDCTCATCRIALFRVAGRSPHHGKSHHHSEHELITVTEGELQVGRDRLLPGMTAAIPANRRYGFTTTDRWEFLNYRSDVSYMIRNPGDEPFIDTLEGIG